MELTSRPTDFLDIISIAKMPLMFEFSNFESVCDIKPSRGFIPVNPTTKTQIKVSFHSHRLPRQASHHECPVNISTTSTPPSSRRPKRSRSFLGSIFGFRRSESLAFASSLFLFFFRSETHKNKTRH